MPAMADPNRAGPVNNGGGAPSSLGASTTSAFPTSTGLPRRFARIERADEVKASVEGHWPTQTIKETDAIVTFLYHAKNQNRTFRLRFADPA